MPSFEYQNKEKLYRVVCRPAQPGDASEVLEFTRTIWEGQDYLPEVWAEWLYEPTGLLAVAEFSGKVVGTGKLTRLSDNQWWLEGLRVHPSFEGQGIASRLHDYLIKIWEKTGRGTIRLVTASFRVPVHKLAQRSGFQQVGELTFYAVETETTSSSFDFQLALADELPEAVEFIKHSSSFQLSHQLIDLGWQWAALEPAFILEAIQDKQVWWWRNRSGLVITREEDEDQEESLMIQLMACDEDDIVVFLQEIKRLGNAIGSNRVGWIAPIHPLLIEYLEHSGYRKAWDSTLYLFERNR